MRNNDDDWQNNVSTIISFLWVFIAPYLANYFTKDQFITLVLAIISVAILVWSAFNPNRMGIFGNKEVESVTDNVESEEDLMNPEYADDCSDEDHGC